MYSDGLVLRDNDVDLETKVVIRGVCRHREFEAIIRFFGPVPFEVDTARMSEDAIKVVIDGEPAHARFAFEVSK